MFDLFWVKMPSKVFKDDFFKIQMSSSKHITDDIAALKIYMYICLFSETENILPSVDGDPNPKGLTSQFTYDVIHKKCNLSRAVISKGIKRLLTLGLVFRFGGVKKIYYVIRINGSGGGWCKLPKKNILDENMCIRPFVAMKNRYRSERDSLKVFIYLLSIRRNNAEEVSVSLGTLSKRTGIAIKDMEEVFLVMASIGFLENIESNGNVRYRVKNPGNELKIFRVLGSRTLVRSKNTTDGQIQYE
jgi:hypothetical protein